ncbi:ATP-dependent RNA helicase glh-1 [Rhynchospora pubera]|uniref:ATP-dependent RNA helicase glh-1 n=1 Tax=Rhynchospora pubera TaxID=906938 RepID=A0AAV8GUU9_9POAL|nr:ATP-dependent RNA helicase glh-1 [Rhynchospora pubera]
MNTRQGRGRGRPPVGRQDGAQPQQQPVPPVDPVPAMDPAAYAQQLMTNLAQIAAQVPERPQVDPFVVARREFQRENTPRFDGKCDFAAAEEWLLAVQDNFRLARTPVEYWTEIAATLFDLDARHWWTSQRPQYNGEEPNIPWQWFEEAFRARFLGETQQEELRRQFETLVQGNMTVQQYGETFIRLSRYAPDLVADPHRKRCRFIRGLSSKLASVVDIYNGTSIEYLMDKAIFQESLLVSHEKAREARQISDGGSARKFAPQVVRQQGIVTSQHPLGTNDTQKKRIYCKPCQRSYPGPCAHHYGRCYLCNSPDHRVADCPFKQNRPSGNSDFRRAGQANQPVDGGLVGRGQVDPRRGQGSNQGHQQQGGQT